MLIRKPDIIEWLIEAGDHKNAFEVEGALPEQVDTDQDRELLEAYGVDVDAVAAQSRGTARAEHHQRHGSVRDS